MEYNSGVSMLLPDSIDLAETDFDNEDIVHEQTKQNEIIELIMAAFEGHDEPSDDDDDDDDDDGSLNTSDTTDHSFDEQRMSYENAKTADDDNAQQANELAPRPRERLLFSPPTTSAKPSSYTYHFETNDNGYLHQTQLNDKEAVSVSAAGHHRLPVDAPAQYISTSDPVEVQYLYHSSPTSLHAADNQYNKFRLLCVAKDQKVEQLQILCEEYRTKYEQETQALRHQLDLSERSRYDWEQSCQMSHIQHEQFIVDAELRIQQLHATKAQLERKLLDSELFITSLQHQVNELRQYESLARASQDAELVLSTTREKHEQKITSLLEKLQHVQMNLQDKTAESDGFRAQLELSYKTKEKNDFEQRETIHRLKDQLDDSEHQYTDLLAANTLQTFDYTETKRELSRMTKEKEKCELQCRALQSEIRMLHEGLNKGEQDVNHAIFSIHSIPVKHVENDDAHALHESIIHENARLKERIDEFASNEQNLLTLNGELQQKLQNYGQRSKRRDSSSSSSSSVSSIDTVISIGAHEKQLRGLDSQIEVLMKEYADLKREHTDLQEKYEYEKHELQTMIEQLREDVIDIDKTKQLYNDVCQEKNRLEETLRTEFEFELKTKLDDVFRNLEQDYIDQIAAFRNDPNNYNQDSRQRVQEVIEDMERLKIQHEKQLSELNNELDRLRANDDATTRLAYVEKEFEQLKHDYYDQNIKHKELLNTSLILETENQNLHTSLGQLQQSNVHLKQTFESEQDRLVQEIEQLNGLIEQQKQDLSSIPPADDHQQDRLKDDLATLQAQINEYENDITKYDDFRVKIESNLQKLTQQRDTYKADLKSTKELLAKKEEQFNQLRLRLTEREQQSQVPTKQHESTTEGTKQNRLSIIPETEDEYRDKIRTLQTEKCQFEQRLHEANRALDLADVHLQQEVEKIKQSLEEEYSHRYELDQKQHQHDLLQLRQELTTPDEKRRVTMSPTHFAKTSLQDIEDIKKMYRTENERLYRENIELSQHQAKLIETHQKQMQVMKKELDDGYNNVINEFQQEQTHLQTRYDELRRQLSDAQQTIEQLKSNLDVLKARHFDDRSLPKARHAVERTDSNLQSRLDTLVRLLEQSNEALTHERNVHTKQEFEYQQTISSLQKKIADMIKHHIDSTDDIKRELHQERLRHQERMTIPRPTSVPEFAQMDHPITAERLREILTNEMIALLRLTCKMIFDLHHRAASAQYMDNLEVTLKKQIQSELIRSCNSMIKEIRREIFEKITRVLTSQGVPDATIDMYIFELDHLLSQLAQDCSNSFSSPSPLPSSSSNLSIQVAPPPVQNRAVVYHTLPSKSTPSMRKSVECLYMTPTMNKRPSSLTVHGQRLLNNDSRPKSASTILIHTRNSTLPATPSPYTHRFQRAAHRNPKQRSHSSDEDLIVGAHQRKNLGELIDTRQQPNGRPFMSQTEPKSLSLPGYSRVKSRPSDGPSSISPTTVAGETNGGEEKELTPSTSSSGIRRFVLSGLKFFIPSPSQQLKRVGQ